MIQEAAEGEPFDLFVQDETRVGLHTHTGRCLTPIGIKPTVKQQMVFEQNYIFGAVSPLTKYSCWMETDECNTLTMSIFLHVLSKMGDTEVLKIVLLDNASWHKSKQLHIPPNIRLIYLPPYSPELNPMERVWQDLKKHICNKNFQKLEDLLDEISDTVFDMKPEQFESLTSYPYLIEAVEQNLKGTEEQNRLLAA